jgi:hypothetical protein
MKPLAIALSGMCVGDPTNVQYSQVLVIHASNPSYSGGRDQEDCKPGQIFHKTLSQNKTKKSQKKGWWEWLKV